MARWPIEWFTSAADAAAQPIARMVSDAVISLPALIAVSIVNGLYEEVFLTGYLLPAFAPFGAASAVGATVLIRILYHLYQGPVGVMSVIAFGGLAGAYFWRTRKLWPVVFAHMLADAAAFAFG